MSIYFDNASTTKPYPQVMERYVEACAREFANANSPHSLGFLSEGAMIKYSEYLASLCWRGARTVFTSGATEANNLAVIGSVGLDVPKRQCRIITSPCEHSSVRAACKYLEGLGNDVVWLRHNEDGSISMEHLEVSLTPETALVSLMQVNNETGVVADIESIKKLVRTKASGALLHVDGVAGLGKIRLEAQPDIYTITAHKIHGTKGIGALILAEGVRLRSIASFLNVPTVEGALPIRAGTADVPAIAAFCEAAKLAFEKIDSPIVVDIKKRIVSKLGDIDCVVNGGGATSPYLLNISALGVKSETLLNALSGVGIYASAGSSCSSKNKQNNILSHYGLCEDRVESAIRLSFSHENTMDEADKFLEELERALNMLRNIGGKGRRRN